MVKLTQGVVLAAGIVLIACLAVCEAAGPSCRNPPVTIHPDQCCEFPKRDKEKAVIEECMAKHGAEAAKMMADKSEGPMRGSCMAECILTGSGHADLESIDEAAELKKAAEMGVEPEWIEVMKGAGEMCRAEGKKKAADLEAGAKLPPLNPGDKVCHPKYGFALMCTMKHMVSHCPAKYFKDTPECKQLQEFSKTCEL